MKLLDPLIPSTVLFPVFANKFLEIRHCALAQFLPFRPLNIVSISRPARLNADHLTKAAVETGGCKCRVAHVLFGGEIAQHRFILPILPIPFFEGPVWYSTQKA